MVIFSEGLCRVAEQYLRKGAKVYIEGQLQTRKWQDQQGQDRYSTEVVLQGFSSTLQMLDSRNGGVPGGMSDSGSSYDEGGSYGGSSSGGFDEPRRPSGGGQSYDKPLDDEIPF